MNSHLLPHSRLLALLVTLCLPLLAPPGRADILTLRTGERIEGCVTAEDDEGLTVQTAGGEVRVAMADLYVRVTGDELLKQYEARARRTRSRTADQLSLAEWCALHCLDDQVAIHAGKVLEKRPDHLRARELMGFTRDENGAWVAADGSPDPYAAEEGEEDDRSRRQTGGARSADKEWLLRWEKIDKSDAKGLRDLAYFCRSENLKEQAVTTLRALFLVVPDDAEGVMLAEHFGIDRGLLQSEGLSDRTLVVLRDGKELIGKVVQDDRRGFSLEVDGLGRISISARDVKKRRLLTLEEAEFYARRGDLKPTDAKGHLELCEWALSKGLDTLARGEAEIVIGIDDDHKRAREILGHVYDKKLRRWVAREEGRDLGDLAESSAEYKRRRAEEKARSETMLELLETGGDEVAGVVDEALEMKTEFVVPVLFAILENHRENEAWITQVKRKLYEIQTEDVWEGLQEIAEDSDNGDVIRDCIDVIGQIQNEDAAVSLVELMSEVDTLYKEEAYDRLAQYPSPTVDKSLLLALQKFNGPDKERVILLSGELRAEGTVPALIQFQLDRHPFETHSHSALVAIGWPAVPALIESLNSRAHRKQTVKVLRDITGETLPISHRRWMEWWKTYTGK